MNCFISSDLQQHEVYKECPSRFKDELNENPQKDSLGFFRQGRHLHHIIRHDSVATGGVILLILSFEMIHYHKGHLVPIID